MPKRPESRQRGPITESRGISLLRQFRGDPFAASAMNPVDATAYQEAMVSLSRAVKLKEVLGGNYSSENAARVFTELARELSAMRLQYDNRDRQRIEDAIAAIASAYHAASEGQGLGDVLQAARDGRESLVFYAMKIAKTPLEQNIIEALALLE